MKILLIHPRRGLFQITKCQDCGYVFECENCDAKLVTYKKVGNNLELVCHQCQSYYSYPNKCPSCGSSRISSKYSGIDDLAEKIEKKYQTKVGRLDKINFAKLKKIDLEDSDVFVTTRVFDPAIDYSFFDKIVFIQADNLLASPDYLVQEDITKNLAELFLSVDAEKTTLHFDTHTPSEPFFVELAKLNVNHPSQIGVNDWFFDFLEREKKNRQMFGFPPFKNLILLTTQEKKKENAYQILERVKETLEKEELEEVQIGSIYPAKFLKRRNMFSYHLLVKYPKQYTGLSKLKKLVYEVSGTYKLQVRLNPKHLF
jgi:primosomal protein N' (replication factor Y)